MANAAHAAFDLILFIDGVEYPCASASLSFPLNGIPQASIMLGVGIDIHTGRPAPVHTHGDQFLFMHKAALVLYPIGEWVPGDRAQQWTKAGPQVIFDGYLTGVSYSKQRGALRASVQLIHWLSDLAFSSSLSSDSHPENPAQYSWRAVYRSVGFTAQARSHFIGELTATKLFTPSAIESDLWGNCIQPMFGDIASSLLFVAGSPCGGDLHNNDQGLAALKRIEGPSEKFAAKKSEFYSELALPLAGESALVARAIATAVRKQTLESYWTTTLWDKLVGDLAPAFMFAVVPKVDTAQIVPFTPGLRPTYEQEIDAADAVYVESSSYIPRPIRAVGIHSTLISRVGTFNGTDRIPRRIDVGGCFSPGGNPHGMVLLRNAPAWLASVPALSHSPIESVLGGGLRPTSSATTPQKAKKRSNEPGEKPQPGEVYNSSKTLFDRLAKMIYITEVLRGRSGTIQGKLRFDIAPGSNVRIRNLTAGGAGKNDLTSQDLVASVMRTSIVLDAEAPAAATSFQLAHIRSLAENESDVLSVDSHPLFFGQQFLGSPLVEAYKFK